MAADFAEYDDFVRHVSEAAADFELEDTEKEAEGVQAVWSPNIPTGRELYEDEEAEETKQGEKEEEDKVGILDFTKKVKNKTRIQSSHMLALGTIDFS